MNTNSIEHAWKQLFSLCLRLWLFFDWHEQWQWDTNMCFWVFTLRTVFVFWESTSRYLFLWAGIFCDFWEQKCEKQRSIELFNHRVKFMSNNERQYRVLQSLSEIVSNSEKQTSAMLSQERRDWLYNCVWNECFKLKERPNGKVISF